MLYFSEINLSNRKFLDADCPHGFPSNSRN